MLALAHVAAPMLQTGGAPVVVISQLAATGLWGFGVWWLAVAVALLVRYLRTGPLPFGLGWWAFTFPLGAFTVGTRHGADRVKFGMDRRRRAAGGRRVRQRGRGQRQFTEPEPLRVEVEQLLTQYHVQGVLTVRLKREVERQIRQSGPGAPFILCTGSPLPSNIEPDAYDRVIEAARAFSWAKEV